MVVNKERAFWPSFAWTHRAPDIDYVYRVSEVDKVINDESWPGRHDGFDTVTSQTQISSGVPDGNADPVTLSNFIHTGTYDGSSADGVGRFEFTTT